MGQPVCDRAYTIFAVADFPNACRSSHNLSRSYAALLGLQSLFCLPTSCPSCMPLRSQPPHLTTFPSPCMVTHWPGMVMHWWVVAHGRYGCTPSTCTPRRGRSQMQGATGCHSPVALTHTVAHHTHVSSAAAARKVSTWLNSCDTRLFPADVYVHALGHAYHSCTRQFVGCPEGMVIRGTVVGGLSMCPCRACTCERPRGKSCVRTRPKGGHKHHSLGQLAYGMNQTGAWLDGWRQTHNRRRGLVGYAVDRRTPPRTASHR